MNLFPASFRSLESALDAASLKQRVISSNIANVDTQNFKSKEVSFQSALNQALDQQSLRSYRTNERHLAFSTHRDGELPQAKVFSRQNTLFNHNGNNVDMDYEMAQMAKNQLLYSALTERMNGRFNNLRTVINDGR